MQFTNPSSIPQRTLSDGIQIPGIGMGTFASDRFSPETVASAVAGAIDCGYRLFDCASVYGNEAQIGNVFADAYTRGTIRRDELFIISKLWNDRHKPGDVLVSLAQSLKDLQTEYLDAYFVHWPFPNYHAPGCDGDSRNPDSVPFHTEDYMGVWRQMERVYDLGLVKTLGMSNMTIKKLDSLLPLCRVKPTLLEMELHPAFQQPALFDYAVAHGIQPVGFCPLGSPGRPARDTAPEDVNPLTHPVIVRIAQAHRVHPAIVCLKWAVQRGQIPIPFSVKPEQYTENLRCVTVNPLTTEEMEAIRGMDAGCRLIKGQVFLWPGATDWHELWD
ncbi:MAG: aldo/keto reductase [Christensenellales bacterium]|jgi:alcohol dehydrogenase (NADP+)